MTSRRALGAVLVAVALFAAFTLGDMTGRARSTCLVVDEYREAIMAEPGYWTSRLRTFVEACDRGSGGI